MTVAMTSLLLVSCGTSGSKEEPQANATNGPNSSDQANSGPGPAAGNMADRTIPGPSDMADGLVGRWGIENDCGFVMEFTADGRMNMPGPSAKNPHVSLQWRVVSPGILELSKDGRGQSGRFELRDGGRVLRLEAPNSPPAELTRC